MPRSYLTLAEREQAEKNRALEKENFLLRSALKDKIFRKIGYDSIVRKTGYSINTVSKIVNHPEKATVEQLRAVFDAAGLPLQIVSNI